MKTMMSVVLLACLHGYGSGLSQSLQETNEETSVIEKNHYRLHSDLTANPDELSETGIVNLVKTTFIALGLLLLSTLLFLTFFSMDMKHDDGEGWKDKQDNQVQESCLSSTSIMEKKMPWSPSPSVSKNTLSSSGNQNTLSGCASSSVVFSEGTPDGIQSLSSIACAITHHAKEKISTSINSP